MELCELMELKAVYEKELILAKAKVEVISDIIAKAEAKELETGDTETEAESEISAVQIY